MDHLAYTVSSENSFGNILGILQIYLILLIVAVVGKFRISGYINFSFLIRTVLHTKAPHLIRLSQGYIIPNLRMNTAVICHHPGISSTVVTFTFIFFKILSYRLP